MKFFVAVIQIEPFNYFLSGKTSSSHHHKYSDSLPCVTSLVEVPYPTKWSSHRVGEITISIRIAKIKKKHKEATYFCPE